MSENNRQPRPDRFNVLTYKVPCPGCGATVEFASVGSVMSVCTYCQTTVVREGDNIKAQGKQSLVIEDYSPLQLGSIGTYAQETFVLVGRIQLEYGEGIWNEWYLQFDNGKTGWLSEALGQYSLTFDRREQPSLPGYHQLQVGQTVAFNENSYTVTDKRTATAIAGEGELPFIMGKGWQTWVIDARYKRQFITLDYADNGADSAPIVYQGNAVTLDKLQMQYLKDDRQLSDGGKIKEEKQALAKIDCPNCGSPVPYVAGTTHCLLCPACRSEVKLTGKTAELVEVHSMMQAQTTSLQLGDKARINLAEIADISEPSVNQARQEASRTASHDYVIIGIMRLQEVGEYAFWTEYLLYSFTNGFLWLVEEPGDWRVARVLNELPTGDGKRWISYQNKKWYRKYDEDYQSQVVYAIGAFNWQVKIYDAMVLRDFSKGQQVISREKNNQEITYTISSPVSIKTINAWFGKQLTARPAASTTGIENPLSNTSHKGNLNTAIILLVVALVIFMIFFSDGSSTGYYSTGGRTGYSSSGSHK